MLNHANHKQEVHSSKLFNYLKLIPEPEWKYANWVMNIIKNLLAHDSNWPVSRSHLLLGNHIKHLNKSPCIGSAINRPLSLVELGNSEPIHCFSSSRL